MASSSAPPDWRLLLPRVEREARALWARSLRRSASLGVDDLVQVGQVELWRASLRWREDGGADLWAFAKRAVLGAMARTLKAASQVRLVLQHDLSAHPGPERDSDLAIDSLREHLLAEEEDRPVRPLEGEAPSRKRWTVRELAERLGVTERAVRARIEAGSLRAKRRRGQWTIEDWSVQGLLIGKV